MAIWSNWDNRGWVKLDVLARALNVENKSGSGSQVAQMWAAGQGRRLPSTASSGIPMSRMAAIAG